MSHFCVILGPRLVNVGVRRRRPTLNQLPRLFLNTSGLIEFELRRRLRSALKAMDDVRLDTVAHHSPACPKVPRVRRSPSGLDEAGHDLHLRSERRSNYPRWRLRY